MALSTSKHGSGRTGHPQRLGESIQAFVRGAGLEQPLAEQRVLLAWPKAAEQVAGERAVTISRSERIQAGELIVRIRDPSWRHRLRFEEQRFVKLLNKMAGATVIQSIRFT